MDTKITSFLIGSAEIGKWLYQNKAEFTGDFVGGCLLDNYVVVTKRGFAAVYEHYLSPNSSCYYIEFQSGSAQAVFRNWYKFEKANC